MEQVVRYLHCFFLHPTFMTCRLASYGNRKALFTGKCFDGKCCTMQKLVDLQIQLQVSKRSEEQLQSIPINWKKQRIKTLFMVDISDTLQECRNTFLIPDTVHNIIPQTHNGKKYIHFSTKNISSSS